MKHLLLAALLVVAATGCSKKNDAPVTPPVPKTEAAPATAVAAAPVEQHDDAIAWRRGDVDAAFAEARAANKPVFLYWGASWCPPCNQMKATLFNKREFVERTRFFVPVYVDGDTPAAQNLGTRFSVSGYPTMVLFKSDGTEITRLPGEVDPEHYLQMLTLGMNSARPVRATLQRALGDGKGLSQDDWRMLAWYSWDTDDQTLVARDKVGSTLQALAAKCPAGFPDAHDRLLLKTAAAAGSDLSRKKPVSVQFDRKAALAEVEGMVATQQAARDSFDLLLYNLTDIVRATTAPGSAERARLVEASDRAFAQLAADTTLSNTDRLGATLARVDLATIDSPAGDADHQPAVVLTDALKKVVVAEVARADRESINPYERQTVINTAGYLLASAGMLDASDALYQAELARSHSPYYFMLDLAANARRRGDKATAVDWYAKAYDGAKGPATRLQWGATYVDALIELAPDDAARIGSVATQVLHEVQPEAASFDGRNRRALSRVATKIAAWNAKGAHEAQAAQVKAASQALCERLPTGSPERDRCAELLKVDGKTA